MEKTYNYLYKITNKKNGKYYYGIHSTNKLNDGYMGSGTALNRAYEIDGLDNFEKEIVAFYDTRENLLNAEREIVNENTIADPMCYNVILGGDIGIDTAGMVTVKDKNGKMFQVSVNDPRYLSGELKHNTKGKAVVRDKNGKTMQVDMDDPRIKSGELESILKGYAMVRDENGNVIRMSTSDPNYHKYKHINKDKVIAKDQFGNSVSVYKDDPRLKNGELVGITKGEITVYDKDGSKITVKKGDPRFKTGELHGFRKDLVTVIDKNGNRLTVRNDDPRFLSGELKSPNLGRTSINKNGVEKHVYNEELQKYLDDGWIKGRLPYPRKKRNILSTTSLV